MKIMHRVATNATAEEVRAFSQLGFELKAGELNVLKIPEGEPRWPNLEEVIKKYKMFHMTYTVFNSENISSADFVSLSTDWHHGYPQPDDDFGYRKMTYDDLNYCETCGIRGTQKAPFRFSREPKWGRKSIMAVNWVYDELFVLHHVWENVFRPLGIQCREVLHHRSGKVLETVVQLVVPLTDIGLDLEAVPFEICALCSRKKYASHTRGFHPPLDQNCSLPIFKTKEHFGSGGSAYRPIIISKSLCAEIRNKGLKGGSFEPLAKKEFPPEQSKPF